MCPPARHTSDTPDTMALPGHHPYSPDRVALPGLSLVQSDHMTRILASDWPRTLQTEWALAVRGHFYTISLIVSRLMGTNWSKRFPFFYHVDVSVTKVKASKAIKEEIKRLHICVCIHEEQKKSYNIYNDITAHVCWMALIAPWRGPLPSSSRPRRATRWSSEGRGSPPPSCSWWRPRRYL